MILIWGHKQKSKTLKKILCFLLTRFLYSSLPRAQMATLFYLDRSDTTLICARPQTSQRIHAHTLFLPLVLGSSAPLFPIPFLDPTANTGTPLTKLWTKACMYSGE